MKHEELINKIKEELSKLNEIEDEKVKEVTTNIEKYVAQLNGVEDENSEEDKGQDQEDKEQTNKEEENEEEVSTDSKEEDKQEDSPEESTEEPKEMSSEIENEDWSTEYINNLPDTAFAVLEPAYVNGDTEDKNARHLPHHSGEVEDDAKVSSEGKISGDGDKSVDMTHYRNALARAEQIKPITDSISQEDLINAAKEHLRKHRDLLKTEEEGEVQLKEEVSKKLEEAAMQLNDYEKKINSKDTEIEGYKAKIQELEAELGKYKEQEKLELEQQRKEKVQNLLELYSKLGLQKTYEELDSNFSNEQIDNLVADLSSVKPVSKKTGTGKDKRVTNVTRTVELNAQQNKRKELTPKDTAKVLFGIE